MVEEVKNKTWKNKTKKTENSKYKSMVLDKLQLNSSEGYGSVFQVKEIISNAEKQETDFKC